MTPSLLPTPFLYSTTRILLVITALLFTRLTGQASARQPGQSLRPCVAVTLSASYLAQASPGSGSGFHFSLRNETAHPIKLAKPVASSAHWYARENGRWMWRASSGEGGALVNAHIPQGPMFAYQASPGEPARDFVTVASHSELVWDESTRENAVLLYRPSCRMCNYPLDRQYRVVFGYAYLPPRGAASDGLLNCGLRSNQVDMPTRPPRSAQE